MTTLPHKPYLVKVLMKGGGGGRNIQKSVHVVYGYPLYRMSWEEGEDIRGSWFLLYMCVMCMLVCKAKCKAMKIIGW